MEEGKVEIELATTDKEDVWYDVDYNRIRDIGDVINILQGMRLAFSEEYLKLNPSLKPYVKIRTEKENGE
jgi:hypothetical protein